MGGQGYQSYFSFTEEGTQSGTEANQWGVDSGLYQSFMYFDSESMAPSIEQKFLQEIGRSGTQDRGVKRHRLLGKKCEGSVDFVVYPEGGGDKAGIAQLLKHTVGDISSGTYSGAGTNLHTFTPHDNIYTNLAASASTLAGTARVYGLSVNMGREDTQATIRNYPYLGCRVRSINLACEAGDELKGTVDLVGRVAKAHGAGKSPSYSTMAPFLFKDATFQIGVDEAGANGTVRTIDAFNINIANNLLEQWVLGTEVLGRCVPNGQRVVTGSFTAPFEAWVRDEYDKWVAGTASSLNIAFLSSPYILEIRCPNIYYTGNAPNIGSMEETTLELPFQALVSTNFDIRIFMVNTDPTVGFGIT